MTVEQRCGSGTEKAAARAFGVAGLAEAIVQSMDEPLLILTGDLTVTEANPAFYDLFRVGAAETLGRPLYELGSGQWNIPELRRLLERVLPRRAAVKGYRVEHTFPSVGKRVMILNATQLPADNDRPNLILLVISDRTDAEQARFALEGYREFQEKLIDSVREALLVLDSDLRVVRANRPFYDIFKVLPAETDGRPVYELGNRQWDIPRLRELLESVLPRNEAFDDVEVEHEFETIGRRIMLLNGRRLDHLDLILLAIRDVTEQRRMEARQRTLMGELHHRVRNILASVTALASHTLRESTSLEAFGDAFRSRLENLARTQELLVRAPDNPIDIAEVVRMELQAQGGREGTTFELDGPQLALAPEAIQALAMVVHELTTNAAKHGALAGPGGRVQVEWTLRAGDEGGDTHVRLRWREHGVAIDVKPARRGFGSHILEHTIRHALDGTSRFTLHPDGAEFVAEFRQ